MRSPPDRIRFFSAVEPVNSFYRDLLPHLAAFGVDIEVFIASPVEGPRRPPLPVALAETPVRVVTFPAWLHACRVVSSLSYAAAALARGAFGARSSLNVFLTQPPFFHMAGPILRALRGQPFCVVVMDVYPDLLLHGDASALLRLPARFLLPVSRRALKRASKVVAIGRCMADRLARIGVLPSRLHTIPNWSPAVDKPAESNRIAAMRRALRVPKDAFVVLYAGNMGIGHSFEELLTVAERMRDEKHVHFVLVGGGRRLNWVEETCRRSDLANVHLLPPQPGDALSDLLELGTVHYVSLREEMAGLMVPSKAYSSWSAARPVVFQGPAKSEIALLIREHDIGSVVAPGSADALEAALVKYQMVPSHGARQGFRALALSRGKLGREAGLKAYTELLFGGLSHPPRW